MYLWCHTTWKQSQAVSDVVYLLMEKDSCITRFFSSVYTRRGETPCALGEGHQVSLPPGQLSEEGGVLSNYTVSCVFRSRDSKKKDFPLVEDLSTQRSY